MLNTPFKTMTELPLPTVNINSYGQAEQVSYKAMDLKYQMAYVSDKGCNKQENEDGILVKYGDTAMGTGMLMAVADGVGGLACGYEASRIAIDALEHWWSITLKAIMYSDIENIHYLINESLSAALHKINMDIYQIGLIDGKRMATTLSVAFILNDWYCIKHVGDSRIYLISDNLLQLTEDHNLLNQLLKSGSADAVKCSYKALNNVLTKCLGIKPELELFELMGKISATEGILLCSDGLYKLLSTIELYKSVNGWRHRADEMQRGLQLLIDKARKRGERDDITAVVMVVERKQKRGLHRLLELMARREQIC